MEILPYWIGRSRIEAARLAERERCAQVCDSYRQELSTWTAEDDHGHSRETQQAVTAILLEAARRIRARGDAPSTKVASTAGGPR